MRTSPPFIPIAHTAMLLSTLVRFLDGCFQPHLDQMKHRAIDNSASYRLQKFGVWKGIEVAAEICVYNFSMAVVDQLMDVLHGVQCAAVLPIGVLFQRQISLEDGLEDQHRRRFRHPIPDSGHS